MDFTLLESRDAYARYFNHLGEVFSRLLRWYSEQQKAGQSEAEAVAHFLRLLLNTVSALRFKYTYHPTHSLKVDVTDSGFPASPELIQLETDLARRDEALREIPPGAVLRRKILDQMFLSGSAPRKLLGKMSERRFLESLVLDGGILREFTLGELRQVERDGSTPLSRSYLLTWACYDFVSSRPYIHLLTFDQDAERPPLEEDDAGRDELMRLVRGEGSRAPGVGILATAIDHALPYIHPKVLKRVCVGPLYSRFLTDNRTSSEDPLGQSLLRLLTDYARRDDDFVLFFDDEIVFSKRQELSTGAQEPVAKVREIFFIPESDPACYARRASVVHRNVMMPHLLLQHAETSEDAAMSALRGCVKIAYTDSGEFHGI